MRTLDDVLKSAHPARLIPAVSESSKEKQIVSILLATLTVVRPFAEQLLRHCEAGMGKTSKLRSYTEVEFPSSEGSNKDGKDRPDGILSLLTRKTRWTALVEAKINDVEIDKEQALRYAKVAREYGIDAVITISNQLTPLAIHVPYTIPKNLRKRVKFFHMSWIHVLTLALLILRDKEEVEEEQAFILGEMAHYFEHPKSGVKYFDRMNREWTKLVQGVRDGQKFNRSSPEIENTATSWHQEEQDIRLILSRRIGERIRIRLPRKHQGDSALRLRETSNSLIDSQKLCSGFRIPNAVSDLEVVADLQRRTVSCSMRLDAPQDRKRASARINWLARQLRDVADEDVIIRAFWPGRTSSTQGLLSKIKADPKCLEEGVRSGATPTKFEVAIIRDLSRRFSGPRTFIEELEKLVPEFYDRIGQRLRPWIPPPSPIDKRDPLQGNDVVDEANKANASSRKV